MICTAPRFHVARWDGAAWISVGGAGGGSVYALESAETSPGAWQLFAGGQLTSVGGVGVDHLARWDGAAWHDLDGGVAHAIEGSVVLVKSLAWWDDTLVVGGNFLVAGGMPSPGIARWGSVATGVEELELPGPTAEGAAEGTRFLAVTGSTEAPRFLLTPADAARLKVRLYDVLGRRVALLHEGARAAGTHEIALSATVASGLASGIYFAAAEVESGGRCETLTARAVWAR